MAPSGDRLSELANHAVRPAAILVLPQPLESLESIEGRADFGKLSLDEKFNFRR